MVVFFFLNVLLLHCRDLFHSNGAKHNLDQAFEFKPSKFQTLLHLKQALQRILVFAIFDGCFSGYSVN